MSRPIDRYEAEKFSEYATAKAKPTDDLSTKAREIATTCRRWAKHDKEMCVRNGAHSLCGYCETAAAFIESADLLDQLTEAKEKAEAERDEWKQRWAESEELGQQQASEHEKAEALLDEIEKKAHTFHGLLIQSCPAWLVDRYEKVLLKVLSKRENQKREGGTE